MKYNQYITAGLLLIGLTGLFSCDSDFLDRAPLTSVTDKDFFKTVTDLETYTNGFYSYIGANTDDTGSDNVSIHTGGNISDRVVTGKISSSNVDGWEDEWENLRSINYFLAHADNAVGVEKDINNYIGIGRFFRARLYVGLVKNYSDVPWYSYPLAADDESMYKAADPRAAVMDSVLTDLEYAVDNIKEDLGSKTRISRWAALAYMSRVCLYEGTYRKYHSELNLSSDYKRFLEKAIWACEEIMKSEHFGISGTTGADYGALFCSPKLSSNLDAILIQEADAALGVGNNTHAVMGWQWSLSRSLMESYLMQDGTPFTQTKGYDKKTFVEVFEGRDPRMAETISYPGFKQTIIGDPYLPKLTFGGYDQLKFYPRDETLRKGWGMNYTSLPIYRYAEVLLNYAEARAELGLLTQDDIENTINKIRARVGMPGLDMAKANGTPDPVLMTQYPNVSGSNKGVILEIRRERRVEMACEGLRKEDVQRWEVGRLLADSQEGIYVDKLGAFDVTGDGEPDVAVLASPQDQSPIADLPESVQTKLAKYYLLKEDGTDDGFYLTNGTNGFVAFTVNQKVPRSFVNPQYYYLPIPQEQILLNDNLKQPFGWK